MDLCRDLDDLDCVCGDRDVVQVGPPAEQWCYQVVSDLSGVGAVVGLDLEFDVAQVMRRIDVDRGCLRVAGAVVQVNAEVVDVGGDLELDRRGAELLFQVLTEREEKSAIAIASNEPFSGWTKTFTDPRLCAAIVDRLTFNGQIIETGTASYRLAHARATRSSA